MREYVVGMLKEIGICRLLEQNDQFDSSFPHFHLLLHPPAHLLSFFNSHTIHRGCLMALILIPKSVILQ